MGKKAKRPRKTIKLVNLSPKLTLPLMSTSVVNKLRTIGADVKKAFVPAKKAFTR